MANLVTLSGDYDTVEIVGADWLSGFKKYIKRDASIPVPRAVPPKAPFTSTALIPAFKMREKMASQVRPVPGVAAAIVPQKLIGNIGAPRQPGTGFMQGIRKSVAAGGVARAGMPVKRVRRVRRRTWRNKLRYMTPRQKDLLMKKFRSQRAGRFMMHGTHNGMSYGDIETLSGIGDWGKSLVRTVTSPVRSVAKGVGHTVMEAGRGLKRGDIKKVLASPFKGVGHTVGSQFRDTKSHAEWYYRPSKMRQWMKPMGGAITAAGMIPTPASPFLLAGGAALTAGGAVGEKIYQTGKQREAVREGNKLAAEKAVATKKRNNMYLIGAAGIGALGLFMALK